MGCFPGCFETPGKERRRKATRRSRPRRRVHEVCQKAKTKPTPTATSNPVAAKLVEEPDDADRDPDLRNETKLLGFTKINKKVKFDLNVTVYEAAPVFGEETDISLDTDKQMDQVKLEEKLQKTEGNLEGSKLKTYPLNYRYQYCIQSDDETSFDEDEYDEDLDDSNLDVEDFNAFIVKDQDQEDSYDSCFSLQTEKMLPDLNESSSATSSVSANQTARDRSQFVVLNPVENLSQWKEVKKKHMPSKNSDKENIHVDEERKVLHNSEQRSILQNSIYNSTPVAVDGSLSVWLAPRESSFVEGSALKEVAQSEIPVPTALGERPVGSFGICLKHSGPITIN